MKRAISILSLLAFLLCAGGLHAQEAPTQIKLARVLSYQKKYDESLSYYNRYIEKNPKAYGIILEAADVTFWSGDQKKARELYLMAAADKKLAPKAYYQAGFMELILGDYASAADHFRKVLEYQPDNIDARIKLAQMLSYDKKYPESIREYDLVLEKDPVNLDALSQKADVLSWDQRYPESIATYDKRLELKFDPNVARQKARVLGWWRRYGTSLKAYKAAYAESGDENIRLEMRGKDAYWNKWVRTAIKRYHLSLDAEPKNIESRFDLAQTEAYQREWKKAKNDFQLILDNESGHFRSRDSIKKLKVQTRPYILPEFRYFRAKSGEFNTYIDHLAAGLAFGEAFNENIEAYAGYVFDTYLYNGFSRILRQRGKIGLNVFWPMNLWLNAAYIPIQYQGISRFSSNFETSLNSKPFDPLTVTMFFNRNDLDVNHTVFIDQIRTTDLGGKIQADINRRWTAFVTGYYSWLNDNNNKRAFNIENLVFLSYEPKRLSLDVIFDYYGYRNLTTAYWSPRNFWTTSGVLHWRHFLNRDGLYYGAKDTYYGFKYRFQVDKDNNVYNGGAAEFYHDFSYKTAVNLEVNGIYSSVYDDIGAFVTLKQRF